MQVINVPVFRILYHDNFMRLFNKPSSSDLWSSLCFTRGNSNMLCLCKWC